MFFLPGDFCLIIITFYNMILHKEDVLGNIFLLAMGVFMTLLWVLVNQVRQDIWEKGIRRGVDEDIELNTFGESCNSLPSPMLND